MGFFVGLGVITLLGGAAGVWIQLLLEVEPNYVITAAIMTLFQFCWVYGSIIGVSRLMALLGVLE